MKNSSNGLYIRVLCAASVDCTHYEGIGVTKRSADWRKMWGVEKISCYDPGYEPFIKLPKGTFDGVISTDALEHCPEEDISWIVEEIFSFASKFLFLNVCTVPAIRLLPNGENAHCTVRPQEWWISLFDGIHAEYPHLSYFAAFFAQRTEANGKVVGETKHHRREPLTR